MRSLERRSIQVPQFSCGKIAAIENDESFSVPQFPAEIAVAGIFSTF